LASGELYCSVAKKIFFPTVPTAPYFAGIEAVATKWEKVEVESIMPISRKLRLYEHFFPTYQLQKQKLPFPLRQWQGANVRVTLAV